MTYIKLEDVQAILIDYKNILLNDTSITAVESFWYIKLIVKLSEDINSLPSVSFEEMIEEMIEERKWIENVTWVLQHREIAMLEKLLNKLP